MLASLPPVSQVGEPQPPVMPTLPAPSPPPPPCTRHKCQGCQEFISLVRRLTFQLEALQTEVHHMARAAASPPPSRPVPPSLTPRASTPMGAHTHAVLAPFTFPLRCSASTPPLSRALLLSLPCLRSAPRVAVTLTVTVAGVLTTASLFLAPSLLLLPLALLGHAAPSCSSASCQLFGGLLLHPLHESEVSTQTLSSSSTAAVPTS